jgi:hypothetical protein
LELGESTAFALDCIGKKEDVPQLSRVPWEERLRLDRAQLRGRSDDAMTWFAVHLVPIDWDLLRSQSKLELLRIDTDGNHPSGSVQQSLRAHQHRSLIYSLEGNLKLPALEILCALIKLHEGKHTSPFKLAAVASAAKCSEGQIKKFSPALQSLGLVTKIGRVIDITSTGRSEASAAPQSRSARSVYRPTSSR